MQYQTVDRGDVKDDPASLVAPPETAKTFRFVRNLGVSVTWLPGSGDDVGMTNARPRGSVILPAPLRESAFERCGVKSTRASTYSSFTRNTAKDTTFRRTSLHKTALDKGNQHNHANHWFDLTAPDPSFNGDLKSSIGNQAVFMRRYSPK